MGKKKEKSSALPWLRLGKEGSVNDLPTDGESVMRIGEPQAREQTDALRMRLIELQERLYAESRRSVLVVLQGMDTAGKDGAINKVFSGVNPLGVKVARFGVPNKQELAHDYLWRVHQQVPAAGEICIFNRSHYEDVLVVRVNKMVPKEVWHRRFRHIREFEKLLDDEGTRVIKFFLHISKEEQRSRLVARLTDPTKNWKFQEGDLEQRKLWPEYQKAYTEAIRETDTEHGPWFVVPADRKWYRDYVVMSVLVSELERMDPRYPKPRLDPSKIEVV